MKIWVWANDLEGEERDKATYLYENVKKETEEVIEKVISNLKDHPLHQIKNTSYEEQKLRALRYFIKLLSWETVKGYKSSWN